MYYQLICLKQRLQCLVIKSGILCHVSVIMISQHSDLQPPPPPHFSTRGLCSRGNGLYLVANTVTQHKIVWLMLPRQSVLGPCDHALTLHEDTK